MQGNHYRLCSQEEDIPAREDTKDLGDRLAYMVGRSDERHLMEVGYFSC